MGHFGGTHLYNAPEVSAEDGEHGRSADIFSLGCVFLEMASVLIGPPGSRSELQKTTKREPYPRSTVAVLKWMQYLMNYRTKHPGTRFDGVRTYGASLLDCSFLMMDPDRSSRIDASNLVAVWSENDAVYNEKLHPSAYCQDCVADTTGWNSNNTPSFHSKFKHAKYSGDSACSATFLHDSDSYDWSSFKDNWLKPWEGEQL